MSESILLACGHLIVRPGEFFQPTELCPLSDGWQNVMGSEVARLVAGESLTATVTKALESASPHPPTTKENHQ